MLILPTTHKTSVSQVQSKVISKECVLSVFIRRVLAGIAGFSLALQHLDQLKPQKRKPRELIMILLSFKNLTEGMSFPFRGPALYSLVVLVYF